MTQSTRLRQCLNGLWTPLWLSLSGPARAWTWTQSNISGETGKWPSTDSPHPTGHSLRKYPNVDVQSLLHHTHVTYISAGIQLYKSPEGGQLKNQQPSKSPSSASAQKRAFSSCCGTKGMCGNASQRHSFISWLSKHPQRNIWILMCTLSLICLWNMNINLGKRGLISNRALTWNV